MTDLENLRSMALQRAGAQNPALPRLQFHRIDSRTEASGLIYEPVVCLVLQGRKRTFIGDETFEYGPGEGMIVAAEIAAMGQVCQASVREPYLALSLVLDPALISALLLDMGNVHEPMMRSGFELTQAGPSLLETWRRFTSLLDSPDEIRVIAPLLEQELMFRLLMGPQSALLKQIAGANSRLTHIRRAMAWIREHYAERLSIDAMAAVAGMSVSVFHRRFSRYWAEPVAVPKAHSSASGPPSPCRRSGRGSDGRLCGRL